MNIYISKNCSGIYVLFIKTDAYLAAWKLNQNIYKWKNWELQDYYSAKLWKFPIFENLKLIRSFAGKIVFAVSDFEYYFSVISLFLLKNDWNERNKKRFYFIIFKQKIKII